MSSGSVMRRTRPSARTSPRPAGPGRSRRGRHRALRRGEAGARQASAAAAGDLPADRARRAHRRPGLTTADGPATGWRGPRVTRRFELLAPVVPGMPTQVVDARDLAAWLLDCAQAGTTGTYDAVGRTRSRSAGGSSRPGRWAGIPGWSSRPTQPGRSARGWPRTWAWNLLPMLVAEPGAGEVLPRAAGQAAAAAGLQHRPRSDVHADVPAWEREQGLDRPRRAGLSAGTRARAAGGPRGLPRPATIAQEEARAAADEPAAGIAGRVTVIGGTGLAGLAPGAGLV